VAWAGNDEVSLLIVLPRRYLECAIVTQAFNEFQYLAGDVLTH
jgi:hypothetical protein